jgi:hypothetical protein
MLLSVLLCNQRSCTLLYSASNATCHLQHLLQQYRAKKQSTILKQMGNLIRFSLQEGEAQLSKEYGNVDRQSKASKRGTRFTDLVEFSQEETSTTPAVQKETEEVSLSLSLSDSDSGCAQPLPLPFLLQSTNS